MFNRTLRPGPLRLFNAPSGINNSQQTSRAIRTSVALSAIGVMASMNLRTRFAKPLQHGLTLVDSTIALAAFGILAALALLAY